MRTRLSNNYDVAHYFANAVQSVGYGSNFYFEHGHLYSYGRHFCIARHLPGGAVAFTTRGYSSSTAKHLSLARSAMRHKTLVYCNDPADTAAANLRFARAAIRDALESATKKGIRQTTRIAHRARALQIAEQANAYLAALPGEESAGVLPIDTTALESIREQMAAAEEAARKIKEEQRAARLADLTDDLEKWRNREILVRTGLSELPPALRLGDGVIQTSHGAEIPVPDALALWPLILSVRAGERTSEQAVQMLRRVGVYHLSSIADDGAITVGCHHIQFAEIERMAGELNLLGA